MCDIPTEDDLRTCPPDPRWPHQNQTYYCFSMFVDYQRCIRLFNEGHKSCDYFKYCYERLCPTAWVHKWNKQVQENTFPFPLPEKCPKEDKDK